jgi:hypothetical protein
MGLEHLFPRNPLPNTEESAPNLTFSSLASHSDSGLYSMPSQQYAALTPHNSNFDPGTADTSEISVPDLDWVGDETGLAGNLTWERRSIKIYKNESSIVGNFNNLDFLQWSFLLSFSSLFSSSFFLSSPFSFFLFSFSFVWRPLLFRSCGQ